MLIGNKMDAWFVSLLMLWTVVGPNTESPCDKKQGLKCSNFCFGLAGIFALQVRLHQIRKFHVSLALNYIQLHGMQNTESILVLVYVIGWE